MNASLAGLYAITPDGVEAALLMELVDAAIAGGANLIQYRDKTAHPAQQMQRAQALVALCRARSVPLIVNDSVDLALAADADGVHLGEHDGAIDAARRRLPAGRLIGVSCYQSLALAQRAVAAGADYVAFGSVFASSVKPLAHNAPLSLFADARAAGIEVPLVGIGGIDADNLAALIAAGADAAAVISAVFEPPQRDAVFAHARALALPFRA